MTQPVRTLIIEDDHSVADVHRLFVDSMSGFAVTGVAHTGRDALRQMTTTPFDLVLLDLNLPDISGLDVLRSMRSDRRLPSEVVALTAARDVASVNEARTLGVRHYLVKPFSAVVLAARLSDVLRTRKLLASGQRSADQHTIDALLLSRVPPRDKSQAPPKGLSHTTADAVLLALTGAEHAVSAAELSALTGMARNTVRRYLSHLVSIERATMRIEYGNRGRPVHVFRAC